MGIDFSASGGIGVRFTESYAQKAIEKGIFTQDEWDSDTYECLEKLGLLFSVYNTGYDTDNYFVLVIDCENLKEAIEKEAAFRQRILDVLGVELGLSDLEIVIEPHVY